MKLTKELLEIEKKQLYGIMSKISTNKVKNISYKNIYSNFNISNDVIKDEEINIEDYRIKELWNIKKMNRDDLYIDECKIKVKGNAIIAEEELKSTYISLYEENINFNALPRKRNFKIELNYNYYISFKGEKDFNLNAQMFIMFYSDYGKVEVDSILLNEEKIITPNKNAKYFRLAIRLEGKGRLIFKELSISYKKRVGFLSHSNLRKLGFDGPKKVNDLKIACIFDEFTTECFKDMCKLICITQDNWKALLTINKPHLLMVESAWNGNKGVWRKKVAYSNENNIKELRELILWCKNNNIPTVFWNKEDPVHYNVFVNTAKMFDYIFTTDENSVDKYKNDIEHHRVYPLLFAAQPKIHNPIKIADKRKKEACFAGSYYAAKYPERKGDIDRLLDAAVNTIGIEIYDRKYGVNDKDFMFPEKFRPYIQGKLEPDELHIANKGYKVMINVNSVKESPTMFSRRVFEGLACATPVVSSYSEGIINTFGDLVIASDELDDLKDEFTKLYVDKEYYDKKALKAMRNVMEKHTYKKRLQYILNKIGIEIQEKEPFINILVKINTIEDYEIALEIFKSQAYLNKKLTVIIPNNNIFINLINESNDSQIDFLLIDYYKTKKITLSRLLKGDFIGFIDIKNYYGKNYFKDSIIATKYTEADIIGKKAYYSNNIEGKIINEDKQFVYVDNLELDKCIISKKVYGNWGIVDLINRLSCNNMDLFNSGVRFFSIDKFNFIADYQNHDKEIIEKIEV